MDIGQLSGAYRCEKSYNGFGLGVLKSALQKYIRRSNPAKAIFAGIELDLFCLIGEERIRTNLIHRLMIVFLEDVGNWGMWPWMDEMIFKLLALREKRKSMDDEYRKEEMSVLPRVIYAMSSSQHARENSHYRCVYQTFFSESDEIRNSLRERLQIVREVERKVSLSYGRDIEFSSVDEGSVELCKNFLGCLRKRDETAVYFAFKISALENLTQKFYRSNKPEYLIFHLIEISLPEMYSGEELREAQECMKIAVRWFKELGTLKEAFLCWHSLILGIVKNRRFAGFEENSGISERLHLMYMRNLKKKEFVIDEYVYDGHTQRGRMIGRDSSYFATVSSSVCDEDPNVSQSHKTAYVYYKMLSSGEALPEKESEYFSVKFRAQLVTGNSKTDTYFATRKDGAEVFVKGPFESSKVTDKFMSMQLLKKKMGLATIKYEVVHLKPGLFSDSPLGLRHSLNPDCFYPFLMCRPLVNEIPTKMHSSKVWPETEVADWDRVRGLQHLTVEALESSDGLMRDYIENVVFRYVFGIGDLANRNFMICRNRVLSVDEDSFDRYFSLENNMRKVYPVFLEFIRKEKEWYLGVLEKYSEYHNVRLEALRGLV